MHTVKDTCQEPASMITRHPHLSRLQIPYFQARLLPAGLCPGKNQARAVTLAFSTHLKAARSSRADSEWRRWVFTGVKGDDLHALKHKDLAAATDGTLWLKAQKQACSLTPGAAWALALHCKSLAVLPRGRGKCSLHRHWASQASPPPSPGLSPHLSLCSQAEQRLPPASLKPC